MQTPPPPQICEQSLVLSNLNIFLFSSSFGNSEASSFFISRACFLSWQAQNPGPGSRSVFHHWSPLLFSGHMALYSQHCHYLGGICFILSVCKCKKFVWVSNLLSVGMRWEELFSTPSMYWVPVWWRSSDNCNWGRGYHVDRKCSWMLEKRENALYALLFSLSFSDSCPKKNP